MTDQEVEQERTPAHVVNLGRLSKRERAARHRLEPRTDHERPSTRADCEEGGMNAARPCPFVGCRWHLGIDADEDSIRIRFPSVEDPEVPDLTAMPHTCALDVANRGEATIDEIAHMSNVSRQAIDQLVLRALPALRRRVVSWDGDTDVVVRPLRRHLQVVADDARPALRAPRPTTMPSNVALVRPVDVPAPTREAPHSEPIEADVAPLFPPTAPASASMGEPAPQLADVTAESAPQLADVTAESAPTSESARPAAKRTTRATLTHPVTGETHGLTEWAVILGCSFNLLHWRLRQPREVWPLERVLSPPAHIGGGRPRKGDDARPDTLRRRAWEERTARRAAVTVSMPMPIELLERAGYRVRVVSDDPGGIVLFVRRPEVP